MDGEGAVQLICVYRGPCRLVVACRYFWGMGAVWRPSDGYLRQVCNFAIHSRWCGRIFALFVVVLVSACAGSPEPVTSIPNTSSFAPASAPAYQLQAGDKLKLLVFGQEAMSGDYMISADGFLDVAQAGKVEAAGLTVAQLEGRLMEKLRNGIVENPQLSVLLDIDNAVN